MLMLIPHLFADPRLLDAAPVMRAPALETLLGRGRIERCPDDGVAAALCRRLGVARQQDWPIAPLTFEADGGHAERAYWLRADPVHLRVMRDRIVLADRRILALTADEAASLATAIAEHFGPTLSPRPLQPDRWYVEYATPPRLRTTPLECVVGRDIQPRMPQGEDALHVRSVLNEVQMLLHAHPVNTRREARGLPAVNALWLWGGGVRPDTTSVAPLTLYANADDATALGHACGVDVRPLEGDYASVRDDRRATVVLDALSEPGQCGDAYGWSDALSVIERDWFVPLSSTRARPNGAPLTVCDPVNGRSLEIGRLDGWKLWKRRKPLRAAWDDVQ